ncbi:MAG: hypothetical protein AB1425_05725 [Actinomycetota bacterium]
MDERWRDAVAGYEANPSGYEFSATGRGVRYRVFATQYIGYTRFEVAFPHRKLKFDGGYRVRLRGGEHAIRAPVKEAGPWNTYDNYWDARRYRTMWKDLPRGVNQVRAAYYNGGKDEFGRTVLNPAGVDLTPAVARRLGLAKYENAWIYVRFPWVQD